MTVHMNKKFLSLILSLVLLLSIPCPAYATITERKSQEAEELIWSALSEHSPSDVITAGVMGYFWRESQFKSDSVTGWATLKARDGFDLCGYVVGKTDSGMEDGSSRDWFIEATRNCGGYGLGQWYSVDYLEALYDYARKTGASIADAEMQCAFVIASLKENTELWEELTVTDGPAEAGRLIAVYYDSSTDGAPYMGYCAAYYYNLYRE